MTTSNHTVFQLAFKCFSLNEIMVVMFGALACQWPLTAYFPNSIQKPIEDNRSLGKAFRYSKFWCQGVFQVDFDLVVYQF